MKPIHRLGAFLMMANAMNDNSNSIYNKPVYIREAEPEWKRKKCKSCEYFNRTQHPCYGAKPTSKACESYTKRK